MRIISVFMRPSQFKNELSLAFAAACRQVAGDASAAMVLEKPRDPAHGDFCCTAALTLAKRLKIPPRQLAEKIASTFAPPSWVAAVNIAGPGFINVTIDGIAKAAVVGEVLTASHYAATSPRNATVLIESVSANPTGPLHVGHGRACAYGDSLANILVFNGYHVRREYYVNNAGRQMNVLAASVWLRHWLGDEGVPEGGYRGDYLVAVAATLADTFKQSPAPPPTLPEQMRAAATPDDAATLLVAAARAAIAAFSDLVVRIGDIMLETVIKKDMRAMAVDVEKINFFPETQLYQNDSVNRVINQLQERGQLRQQDGALWFKSTAFGDDKDRVVRRANGEPTYFAADIAYHADKLERHRRDGDDYRLINVLGADHHGYVPRLVAAITALGYPPATLETRIIQFVSLLDEHGERLKMSTRAGEFVTLRDLVDNIGADAARYLYVNRKNDQHLDFDLAAAKKQNNSNPVYYIQYAHARICSIIGKWGGDAGVLPQAATDTLATSATAMKLCDALMAYPQVIDNTAAERAPHHLATYLHDTAVCLHTHYEKTRILSPDNGKNDNDNEVRAQLALLEATRAVLASGARLLGFKLPRRM